MSTSGISFSGLASGLDTQSIIQALLAVEQRPILQMENRKDQLSAQKSLFGDITSRLEELVDNANDIRRSSQFVDFQVQTDKEDFLSATASSSAVAGSYLVDVVSIAQAQVNSSGGYADRDQTTHGTGALLFTVDGETRSLSIDSSNNTLEGIASSITSADVGVRAQVVDTGDANEPYKLVLTATEPGAENGFDVFVDPSPGGALDTLISGTMANTILSASDAVIEVDGVQIMRSSNTVSDVIPGVTLNLIADNGGTASPTRITVTADGESTSAKVRSFVDKYNEIVDFLESQSVVDEEGNASSALFGDPTLRSIRTTLRNLVGEVVDTGNSQYSMLSQIGIDSDTDGRLTFTQSEFESALFDDETAVKNLFTAEETGIANRIFSGLDLFTDSIDGLIKIRTDGIDRITKTTNDNIDRAERRLEQLELSLTERFANLEVLMGRLQSQGGAVSNIGAATAR